MSTQEQETFNEDAVLAWPDTVAADSAMAYKGECEKMLDRLRRNTALIRSIASNHKLDTQNTHIWRAMYIAWWQRPIAASIHFVSNEVFCQMEMAGYEDNNHVRVLQGKTLTPEEMAVFFGLYNSYPEIIDWQEHVLSTSGIAIVRQTTDLNHG